VMNGLSACLIRCLTMRFLLLEDFLTSLAKALFVFGGPSLSGGDVGASFFHCALRTAATLGEYGGQRAMDEQRINGIEHAHKDDRGHASEQ